MYIHISDGLGTQKTDFRVERKLNKIFFFIFCQISGLFEDISKLCSPPQLQKSFDKYETKTCKKKNKSLAQLTQPENL